MSKCDIPIECCTNNLEVETWERIVASPVDIDQQHCLQRCGLCHVESFLVHDGDVIRGDHDDLIEYFERFPNVEDEQA